MSCRGSTALRESAWQAAQRSDGYKAGLAGKRDMYADQYYQRGYRAGVARRAALSSTPSCRSYLRPDAYSSEWRCPYLASREYHDVASDEWRPVCGIHAKVAQRRGMVTRVRSSQRRA